MFDRTSWWSWAFGALMACAAVWWGISPADAQERPNPDATRTPAVQLTSSTAPTISPSTRANRDADPQQDDAGVRQQSAGDRDWREVETLQKLEAQAFKPSLVKPGESWDPELLAPYQGTLASIRQDIGAINDQHALPRKALAGSRLLRLPEVRTRLADAEVFGVKKSYNHAPVRAYLDFFDGQGKGILTRWYARMGRYEAIIKRILREEGMPEELIYVAMIESGFSPQARSPASAIGIWQFMRPTGRAMGLQITPYLDERRDPIKSTRAACKYFRWLHKRYGSWPLALAAYNGGHGTVGRAMRQHNTNNFWFLHRLNAMNASARNYVPKIVAAALMSENPELFKLHAIKRWDAIAFDEVEVPPSTRLSLVARAIGSDVGELRHLNPELLHAVTPPGGSKPYRLRIPAGKRAVFVAKFDRIVLSKDHPHTLHRVAFGESVSLLARHYEMPEHVLRAANELRRRERVPYGATLIIPERPRGSARRGSDRPMVFVPDHVKAPPGISTYIYEVNQGDTLALLARAMNVNPADVALWNKLDPQAKLQPFMRLQLFLPPDKRPKTLALRDASEYEIVAIGGESDKRRALRQRGSSSKDDRKKTRGRWRTYTIRKGDSLWTIARRHGVSVDDLERWNPSLRRSKYMRPGQKLKIKR